MNCAGDAEWNFRDMLLTSLRVNYLNDLPWAKLMGVVRVKELEALHFDRIFTLALNTL